MGRTLSIICLAALAAFAAACGGSSSSKQPAELHSGDVAVVDAELGVILSLTSYLGGKPVRRFELRDVVSAPGDFRVDLPPDLHAEPEPDPPAPMDDATPLKLAGAVAQEVGKEAAKAARNFLRRLGSP